MCDSCGSSDFCVLLKFDVNLCASKVFPLPDIGNALCHPRLSTQRLGHRLHRPSYTKVHTNHLGQGGGVDVDDDKVDITQFDKHNGGGGGNLFIFLFVIFLYF